MFLLKKILAPFFFPVSLCVELLLIGVILLWLTQKQKAGKAFVTAGLALLLLFSYRTVPELLLSPLENRFPPFHDSAARVEWIVVLGGGHTTDPRLPAGNKLSEESGMRVLESIRIWRRIPGSKILFSGGEAFETATDAEMMAQTARDLGVPAEAMALEDRSRNTLEEAQLIEPVVGKNPFVLVTSASHMQRSVGLFTKLRMHPIPAPTDYQMKETSYEGLNPSHFYPGAGNLARSERGIYERLGLAWERLAGNL